MQNFLIMIAPPLIIAVAIGILFLWGAAGKEKYK